LTCAIFAAVIADTFLCASSKSAAKPWVLLWIYAVSVAKNAVVWADANPIVTDSFFTAIVANIFPNAISKSTAKLPIFSWVYA
jgi:hypothetical protein